jgi:hypothetical protein
MDYQTFCIVVASLQSAAVHVMTPEGFDAFTRSLARYREDRLPPKEIVKLLTDQLHAAVTIF